MKNARFCFRTASYLFMILSVVFSLNSLAEGIIGQSVAEPAERLLAFTDKAVHSPSPGSEPPRASGLPKCEAELAECFINLSEKENLLQVCQDALAQCQATVGQAFPATGQTSCWDSMGNAIDCTNTGQDGDIRAGGGLSYTDTGLTIIDDNTKLEWMKQDDNDMGCESYPGNLDKDCAFSWDDAFSFVANLNAANHAGGGWRVPNVKELQSIANYETHSPAVFVEFDIGCVPGCTVPTCSCTATFRYWSSTSYAFLPDYAWGVWFTSGFVANFDKDREMQMVRAVRGGL